MKILCHASDLGESKKKLARGQLLVRSPAPLTRPVCLFAAGHRGLVGFVTAAARCCSKDCGGCEHEGEDGEELFHGDPRESREAVLADPGWLAGCRGSIKRRASQRIAAHQPGIQPFRTPLAASP